MRLPRIAELDESSSGWAFFLCARKERRTDRAGADFLALALQDATGQIPAKTFVDVDAVEREFQAGDFVRVEGRVVRPYRKLELLIDKIRRIDETEDRALGFDAEDYIPSAPRPIEIMWQELQARVARARNPWIQRLLASVLDRHADRFRMWPAAMTVHHAYRGGLLEHVLKIAETGESMAAAYGADADLLLAGAVLHDLGKLDELSYDGVTSYSRTGNLLGHITIGMLMLREAARAIDGFPDDLLTRLEHMVLSHHGERERGSPVEPMTAEAFILSSLDDLDATLNQVKRHIQDDQGEGDFTAYHPRLGRVLLKPSGR